MSAMMLATPLMAADFSFSGTSDTVLRMRTNSDKKDVYPLYEYLHLNLTDNRSDGSAVSFYLGAWGRIDLVDKSTDKYSDADLRYAYLSYRGAKNNTTVNLGRQFVSEGVASERLDGLYLRNDFAGGFGLAAFAGKSVTTETNEKGGEAVYGARLSQSMPKYYSIGLSALKSEADNNSRYREEAGIDLWLHPLKQIDLTGRSSYNSITEGWMEHAYTLAFTPLDNLKISADVSNIRYKNYFFHMTTNVFKLFDPTVPTSAGQINQNEELTTAGVTIGYKPIKNLALSADYKHYVYDIAGDADYFGGKVTYALPSSFSAGIGVHRMGGVDDNRLRYTETHAFLTKKLGPVDLAANYHNIWYDQEINGIRNSYVIIGSAGYKFNEKLKFGADVEYSKSPEFDNEVRGLIKLSYAFDMKPGKGGN